jgi:tungstate transport system substrate-binding protein
MRPKNGYSRNAPAPCRHWVLLLLFLLLVVTTGLRGAPSRGRSLVLATTTSTQDTGLLDALVPRFEKQTGLKVKVIAVGTGQALELGRRGDADVLLVHAPEAERQFVQQGHGVERKPVFYNDFVLVGPAGDPARVRQANSAPAALKAIAGAEAFFVSRGDDSGTHKKEQALWRTAGVNPAGRWYLSAGAGMAEALRMASERQAYTLSDRGTYLSLRNTLELQILHAGDAALQNPYAVITVSPRRHPHVNTAGARRFAAFLLTPATQRLVARYGKERYGEPLFHVWPARPKR